MAGDIKLFRKINVLPGNIIIVPGTEPSTTLTSSTLQLEIRKAGLEIPAIIDLKTALDLIPGSRIELIENSNAPVQKLFVLPGVNMTECGLRPPDYYAILKSAARKASIEEKQEIASMCSNNDDYDTLYGS